MSSGRRSEAAPRRSSSIAPLQPESRVESLRSGWFSGRSRAGSLRRSTTESPKTPRNRPGLQELRLPSLRLHIPYLSRSDSLMSARNSGPSASPGPNQHAFPPIISRPGSARSVRQPTRSNSSETLLPSSHQPPGRRFVGVDPAELHLADLAATGRRRRRQKTKRSETLCGPKMKNRKIRAKILTCIISGLFLAMVLTVYLVMALSRHNASQEFHVLLILIILVTTLFCCHSLIRLCMMIIKPPPDYDSDPQTLPAMVGPGGYANPAAPIPVTLARDEEAAGIESEATKIPPPAYGLWRESVRVDPNRIFWQRNQEAPPMPPMPTRWTEGAEGTAERPATGHRPPSYISEDGVEYIVEAAPRSIAPSYDVPLQPHPSERGRVPTLPQRGR